MRLQAMRRLAVGAMCAATLASTIAHAKPERLDGRVVGVHDGDTLTLLDSERREHRIRLAGIDAPEDRQRYGQAAKRALSDLAFGKQASADCPKTDRYGRRVCNVSVNGRDVGLALVQAGAAWHFRAYANEQSPADRVRYARAEESARTTQTGLWADPEAVPPWDWRRGVRVPN